MDFSGFTSFIFQFSIRANQALENFIDSIMTASQAAILDEKSAIWATLVTDIITIAAALGALALPISLNVIETTRTRYRSPSLLKITSSLSGIDAKRLNRHLFMVLAISLVAKLLISIRAFDLISLVPYLCGLTVVFGFVVRQIYCHLRFTYTFMSNIEVIHELIYRDINNYAKSSFLLSDGKHGLFARKLLKINGLFSSRVKIRDNITALIELESYLLCVDPTKTDLDSRIRTISYKAFNNLENHDANEFARHLLASLPSVLATVEVSREVDVYQSIAGFYLSLAMMAILAKEEYRSQIGVIERIARFREDKLPSYGRFCRNGRLFLSFANKAKSGNEAYTYLQAHFNLLIETSAREQPENIPELLRNIRQVIQFKSNYNKGAWDLPEKVTELWGYSSMPELDQDVGNTYAGRITTNELDEKIETKYKPEMRAYIEEKILDKIIVKEKFDAIDTALEECWQGIALNRFSSEIETETLRALATLLSTHPEIFVECRELRNPAGSRSFNVGHSPVPTSLGECIEAFLSAKNFSDFYTVRNDLQEYKIVDAIGALVVYELWNIFILRATGATIKPEMSTPVIPSCQLGELKAAAQRVPLLKTSLLKTMINARFIDRLGILPEQALTLREYACEFCDLLSVALKEKTISQIANQKLDTASLERFKCEVTEKFSSSVKRFDLFKRLTIGQVSPIVSNISLPREAFLSGTDTYYVFDTYGPNLAQEVHSWLSVQILLHNHRTENSEITLPTRKAEWMICSSHALKKFRAAGFTTSGRNITWPDGKGSMNFFEINCDGYGYYLVLSGESLITVSYAHRKNELPMNISFTDNGEHVSFKIEYYVGARQ
ncbi:hypothetical protein AO068_04565 [Pseudomonas sp. ICMP 3272]|uniref:Uncharacterized protein n=4 Tax=Pseudomonas TaxID=286 RepID=A0A3M4ISF6_PSEVI|nr:hypothetical protein AO068_04565 [Pseudomonas sp. ICMP 3272]RMP08567.1 hypothetical protein ALQ30_03594 [Pseudomonas syringae pv. persicae]RMQ07734.1 hypothetical protein ALQ09_01500 [Pseudomonas viridiflava]RMQ78103.1 hypothetical protein ALP98_03069 [Pseudomonas viridiflava]